LVGTRPTRAILIAVAITGRLGVNCTRLYNKIMIYTHIIHIIIIIIIITIDRDNMMFEFFFPFHRTNVSYDILRPSRRSVLVRRSPGWHTQWILFSQVRYERRGQCANNLHDTRVCRSARLEIRRVLTAVFSVFFFSPASSFACNIYRVNRCAFWNAIISRTHPSLDDGCPVCISHAQKIYARTDVRRP